MSICLSIYLSIYLWNSYSATCIYIYLAPDNEIDDVVGWWSQWWCDNDDDGCVAVVVVVMMMMKSMICWLLWFSSWLVCEEVVAAKTAVLRLTVWMFRPAGVDESSRWRLRLLPDGPSDIPDMRSCSSDGDWSALCWLRWLLSRSPNAGNWSKPNQW